MINTGRFIHPRLENVAPYCQISASGWTGSTTGETLFTPDGISTGPWSGRIALPPINPLNSFVLHYTLGGTAYSVAALDDGTIADANVTGQINQDGTYTISSATPLDAVAVTCDYSYGIAPTNLENALNPDSLSYAGPGWRSTTGSVQIGTIDIYPPENGTYLVGLKISQYTLSSASGLSINFTSITSTGNWYSGVALGAQLTTTIEKFRSSLGMILVKDSDIAGLRFNFYANGPGEYLIKIYNIYVFKLM